METLDQRRLPATEGDIADCGWLQTQFPKSFGSGGILGPKIGLDGHLWVFIPISETQAETAARGAGLTHGIDGLRAEGGTDYRLRLAFYKFRRGFFRRDAWVASVHVGNSDKQIFLGFLAGTNLRAFAIDLAGMIERGWPTFPSAPEAYSAIP